MNGVRVRRCTLADLIRPMTGCACVPIAVIRLRGPAVGALAGPDHGAGFLRIASRYASIDRLQTSRAMVRYA